MRSVIQDCLWHFFSLGIQFICTVIVYLENIWPLCVHDDWRMSNREIILLGHENIVGFVKSLGLRWLGHIERCTTKDCLK